MVYRYHTQQWTEMPTFAGVNYDPPLPLERAEMPSQLDWRLEETSVRRPPLQNQPKNTTPFQNV